MFFAKNSLVAFLAFGLAQADFYFGSTSSVNEDGGGNTPTLDHYQTYILQIEGQDICDSSTVDGGAQSLDPSAPWPNFCGQTFSNNGWNVQLNTDDTVSCYERRTP